MSLYELTDGELAIIRRAQETDDPNWFLDWFLKSETTGTYFKPYASTEVWAKRYDALYNAWQDQNEANRFLYKGNEYQVRMKRDLDKPIFFHNHGFRLLPWQIELFQQRKNINVVVGGYGCGKTGGMVALALYQLATVPGYRIAFTAPSGNQAMEAYKLANNLITNTLYQQKFLLGKTLKPPATITVGNSLVGDGNTMEIYSIGDDVSKIETFNLHAAVVDQAEKFENINEVIRVIGSRFRGQVQGYEIEGNMYFLANSADNEPLWRLYDEAESDPDRVQAMSPTTYDNIYITDEQLVNIEKNVGGDDQSIAVHMKGARPLGSGEHFPKHVLEKVLSPALDEMMANGRKVDPHSYIIEEHDKVGIVRWELPYESGHDYLVVFDPGTDNPPNRNSAVGLVWKYTDFPTAPASLVGFSWVYGNHSVEPWIAEYMRLVDKFRAKYSNAIDATGWQSGYVEGIWAFDDEKPGAMSLTISKKARYLNFAKRMSARGLLKAPFIPPLFSQLSRYRLPDNNISQDIVMAYILSAGWLEHLLYLGGEEETSLVDETMFSNLESRTNRYETRELWDRR